MHYEWTSSTLHQTFNIVGPYLDTCGLHWYGYLASRLLLVHKPSNRTHWKQKPCWSPKFSFRKHRKFFKYQILITVACQKFLHENTLMWLYYHVDRLKELWSTDLIIRNDYDSQTYADLDVCTSTTARWPIRVQPKKLYLWIECRWCVSNNAAVWTRITSDCTVTRFFARLTTATSINRSQNVDPTPLSSIACYYDM